VRQSQTRNRNNKPSFKEQQELAALPELIESLEKAQVELQARTAEPSFYQQAQPIIATAMQELADIEEELKQAYERWAEIES
jgi:ATP-binding cassette subfamily F protein uup